MTLSKKKIVFIIGPTASGKTSLSIEKAKKLVKDGSIAEIVSADSRQVYRDLDLSSGKVTNDEMENIPHHLLDVVDPGDYFSVVDYTDLALKTVDDIFSRGNIPIICGGTGFYIDSLLYKYNLPETKKNDRLRIELEYKYTPELYNILFKKLLNIKNWKYFFKNLRTLEKFSNSEYKNNPHRLMRAIEIVDELGYIPELKKEKRFPETEYDVEIISTNVDRQILREKIYKRLIERIDQGMVDEIKNVKEKYNLSWEYLEKLGLEFKWASKFLQNQISKEEMIEKLFLEICQYAKRQDSWFRRYNDYR